MKRVAKMCLRKRRFADQYDADDWGRYRSMKGGAASSSYLCRVCKGWHVSRVKQVPKVESG